MTATEPVSPGVSVLSYAPTTGTRVSRGWHIVSLLATLPAIVALFVPFVHTVSPYEVMDETWRRWPAVLNQEPIPAAAAGFFVILAIAAWQIRLIISPETTRLERIIALFVSLLSLGVTSWPVGWTIAQVIEEGGSGEWGMIFVVWSAALVPLGAGACAMRLVWKSRSCPHAAALIALIAAYVCHVGFCMAVFYGFDPALGWWLTLFAALLHIGEGVVLVRLARGRMAAE